MIAATVIIGLSFFNMLYFLCVLFCCSSCIFNINFFSLLILVFGDTSSPENQLRHGPISQQKNVSDVHSKKNLKDGFERPSTFSLARRVFSRVSPMAVVGERRRRTWNVRSVGNGRDSFAQFSTSLLFISFYEQQKKTPDTFFVWTLSARMRKSLTLHDSEAALRLDWQLGTITRHQNVPEKSRNSREISRKSTFFPLSRLLLHTVDMIFFSAVCWGAHNTEYYTRRILLLFLAFFWGSRQNINFKPNRMNSIARLRVGCTATPSAARDALYTYLAIIYIKNKRTQLEILFLTLEKSYYSKTRANCTACVSMFLLWLFTHSAPTQRIATSVNKQWNSWKNATDSENLKVLIVLVNFCVCSDLFTVFGFIYIFIQF